MEDDSNSRMMFSRWGSPAIAILAIYIVVRIIDNFTSWNVPTVFTSPDQSDSGAMDAGRNYSEMIVDSSHRENQIQTLWRLIQVKKWVLPKDAQINDAPALALELQNRAYAYYRVNDLGQALSYTKILLRWSILMLNSSGAEKTNIQPKLGSQLSQIALDTVEHCPNTLLQPEIKRYIDELRISLENEAGTHFERLLGNYMRPQSEADPKDKLSPVYRCFANKRLLQEMLQSYMGSRNAWDNSLRKAHFKSWFLICPLTWNLFSKSTSALNEDAKMTNSMIAQIRKILASVPSTGGMSQAPADTGIPSQAQAAPANVVPSATPLGVISSKPATVAPTPQSNAQPMPTVSNYP